MDLVDILVDLGRQLGNHPEKVVVLDEGFVAGKVDGHMVISRPGARLGNLDRGDLIHFNPAALQELLRADQPRRQAEEEALLASRLQEDAPMPSADAYVVTDLFDRCGSRMPVPVHPGVLNQVPASPPPPPLASRPIPLTT